MRILLILLIVPSSLALADVSAGTALPTAAEVDALRALVDATPKQAPERAELLLRLAHAWVALADHAPLSADGQALARQWRLGAVELLPELVDSPVHASFARRDEVLFFAAEQLLILEREDAARARLTRLIKEFPRSRFIPHAFLAFGEHSFEQQDLEDARRFYSKVMTFPRSGISEYAQYKRAWAFYDRGKFKAALSDFTAVARGADATLATHARHDAVRVYALIGDPAMARAFCAQIARGDLDDLVRRLGEIRAASP